MLGVTSMWAAVIAGGLGVSASMRDWEIESVWALGFVLPIGTSVGVEKAANRSDGSPYEVSWFILLWLI